MARSKAEEFFYKWGGYSHSTGATKAQIENARRLTARALADAEAQATERGWRFTWEDDPEGYDPGEWEEDDVPKEVLWCALRDEDGHVLESLASIGMSGNVAEDQRYARLIEAELALEALTKLKK